MKKKTIKLFQRIAAQALRPLPNLSVSDWADQYRMLSSESSAEPGRWRTDRAPYQRDIMDAFTDLRIRRVVVMSCSQVGKSDVMNNVIGRFAHLAPAPILMIQPTVDMAQDYSKSRIAPMIRDTKALRDIFRDVKSRESGNTILSKLFPGGRLIMGGANSPAGLASRPIKILLADEVDRFPDSAGTEGDPVDLAAKRMTTFWDRTMGLFSTPTNAGESRIEVEYLDGTQEEWQHQCPNCGEYHLLTHRSMVMDTETVKDGRKKNIRMSSRCRGDARTADLRFRKTRCGGSRRSTLPRILLRYVITYAVFLLTAGRRLGFPGLTSCRSGLTPKETRSARR